jgi:hypothetical protein
MEVLDKPARSALEKLAKDAGVSLTFVANDTMRLCLNDIMHNTPPPTLAAGRATVSGDVQRLFEPITEPEAIAKWRQRMAEGHTEIFTFTDRGRAKVSAAQLKATTLQDMAAIHKANRDRNGRVYARRRRGAEIWGEQFLVPEPLLRKYIARAQQDVGRLMAHWAGPLRHYAGKVAGRTYMPNFVKRHAPGGRVSGRITAGSGSITSTNDLPYARRHSVNEKWWGAMLMSRQKGIETQGRRKLDDLARRFAMVKA